MRRALLVATLITASAGTALAQEQGPHSGFFVRPRVGLSYIDETGNGADTNGFGGFFSVDVGTSVLRPNLLVYGELRDLYVSSPDYTPGGGPTIVVNGSLTAPALGAGASYYLEPMNLYVGGTLLVMQSTFDQTYNNRFGTVTTETSTDWGFGLALDVGKEWRVSPKWGLGVAGDFFLASMDQPVPGGVTYSLTADGFAVLFSATYQ